MKLDSVKNSMYYPIWNQGQGRVNRQIVGPTSRLVGDNTWRRIMRRTITQIKASIK